jgi:cytidine deaminase
MTDKELFAQAREALERAYAPYSGFRVGAAVLTASGAVYCGANIENAAYGATICAERVALSQAVMDGHREFAALAVAGKRGGDMALAWPCGICRQFLFEFGADTRIITGTSEERLETATIGELLPKGFRLDAVPPCK